MLRPLVFAYLLLLIACLVSGCGLFHSRRHPAAATGPHLIGTVALVNEPLGFVLVDVSTSYVPVSGQALKSFGKGGVESGVLTVSPEKRHPFIIADVVKGTPHQGDEVYQ